VNSPLLNVLAFALLPVAAAITGSVIAALRPPGAVFRSYIQHFATGVVFSVVSVELLPDIVREHSPLEVIVGFAFGVVVMLGLRLMSRRLEQKAGQGQPIGLIVGVGVDVLLDGFLIGISFSAGAKEGTLLTIALTVELLSLGLAVSASLSRAGASRRKAVVTASLLFSLIAVGAAIGTLLVQAISHPLLEIILSFGLAALLYLVTEELLVEGHEESETPLVTATLFIGFLLFLILGMIG